MSEITKLIHCDECTHLMTEEEIEANNDICPACGYDESFDTVFPSEGEHWANELARYYAERECDVCGLPINPPTGGARR